MARHLSRRFYASRLLLAMLAGTGAGLALTQGYRGATARRNKMRAGLRFLLGRNSPDLDRSPAMHRSQWTLFALVIALASPVNAQESRIYDLQVVERGIYRAETVGQRSVPGTTGVINTVRNARLISSTTRIPAALGVRFGVRYVVSGGPPGSAVPLRLLISFPPGGLRNPVSGQRIPQNEHILSVPPGVTLYWEYQFENQWEIVPGVWHFEFWSGESKLAEQRFCVHAPAQRAPLPSTAGECRYDLLGMAYSPTREL